MEREAKKGLILASVLVSILMISAIVMASIGSADEAKATEEVLSVLEDSQKVSVVILVDKSGSASEVAESLSLPQSDLSSQVVVESADAIYAQVSLDAIEQLEKNPDINSIEYRPPMHVLLSDSTKQILANSTWPKTIGSTNLTGIGQSICVIDTGVNYTHPDLGGCSTADFLAGTCAKVIAGYDFCNETACQSDDNPMDSNGHGTHVAGIAAANGTIVGVAPGASIVAMKVCNSSTYCPFSAITNAISWCTGNSSVYNISVITISLGTDTAFSSYCDSLYTELSSVINAAVAKNITVTVATGNDGYTTAISSPACIRNATAVGAVNKTDSFFYNRNDMTDIIAPGVSITSTWITGGLYSSSGTSMSTPHVAGAAAVLQQVKFLLDGKQLLQSEVETALKNHSTILNDSSGSGLNFSRLNLLSAVNSIDHILYLDISSLSITYSPVSQFNSTWHSASSVWAVFDGMNHTATNITSEVYQVNISAAAGSHNITWYANDSSGNISSIALEAVNISRASPNLNLTLNSSGTIYTSNILIDNETSVNLTATSSGEGRILLYLNSSLINNATSIVSNTTTFNTSTEAYNITAFYNETQNYTASTQAYFISVESILAPPRSYKVLPSGSTNYTNNATVLFKINATDAYLKNATLYIYNSTGLLPTNSSNITGTFNETNWTLTLSEGNYSWSALVYDNRSNGNWTDGTNNTLVVDLTDPDEPNLTISGHDITTSETTSITCIGSDANLYSVNITIAGSQKNWSTSSNKTTYTWDPSTSDTGSKSISCIVKDLAGNMHTYSHSITVNSVDDDSSSSSSGGSSGGASSASSAAESFLFSSVAAGQYAKMNIYDKSRENTAMQSIYILMRKTGTDFEVSIQNVSKSAVSNPIDESNKSVYKYLQIGHSNIEDSFISEVDFTFEINKTWLKENNATKESVVLERYSSGWNPLKTSLISESSTSITYSAVSYGLSTFAITVKKGAISAPVANNTVTPPLNSTVTPPESKSIFTPGPINWWFIGAAAIITMALGALLTQWIINERSKKHWRY